MSKPPPDTTDNFAAAPERIALIVEQALLLADIATAGAHLGQQMVRQAEQANWLGVEGALMFARVNRAVRQTIAMERSLGAHFEDVTERQRAKLYALMNAGGALIQRLTRQNLDRNFLDGPGGLMMLRLSTATERTMQLLRRIDDEKLLSDAHRSAIWQRRPRRPRPLPKLPQRAARTEAPNVAPNTPPNTPPMGSSDISLAMRATLLEELLDDIEGDIKGTEDPGLVGDVHAPDESLRSEERRGGDRRPVAGGDRRGGVQACRDGAAAGAGRGAGRGGAGGGGDDGRDGHGRDGAGGFPHLSRPLRPSGAERGRLGWAAGGGCGPGVAADAAGTRARSAAVGVVGLRWRIASALKGYGPVSCRPGRGPWPFPPWAGRRRRGRA